jgi:hypothetical protein
MKIESIMTTRVITVGMDDKLETIQEYPTTLSSSIAA